MLTTEAHVETERASRYLVQLCRHFDHVIGPGRREDVVEQHARASNRAEAHPELRAHVQWSETHGLVRFDWGRCTMEAGPDALTLRAEATDEEGLQRVQGLVAEHLERFGERDHLKVSWQPS